MPLLGDAAVDEGAQRQVLRVDELIAYLSSFMTLSTGDVILTGTPEGVVNVNEGDEVVTEINAIGRLVNTLVGDGAFGR